MKRLSLIVAASCVIAASAMAKVPRLDSVSIAKYRDGKKAAISFTFDDSIDDHYNLVAPQLEKNGLRGTFWVIGRSIDADGSLSSAQIREMSENGHEMSNHTWTHQRLSDMDPADVEKELVMTDDALEKITGKRPIAIAFPFNHWTDTVMSISMRGRVAAREFQFPMGQQYRRSTPENLSAWLEKTISKGEWGVGMAHGIHHGWDQWEDENVLWDFFAKTASRSDVVWVGTFSEVASYIKEREACTIRTSVKGSKLTIIPQCDLDHGIFRENLTLVVTIDGVDHHVDFDPFAGPVKINLKKLSSGRIR